MQNNRRLQTILFLAGFILAATALQVRCAEPESDSAFSPTFTPIVMLESWATYSTGEIKNGVDYGDRLDAHMRRLRFGGKGNIIDALAYEFTFHDDRLGEDPYASTKCSDTGVGIWNAYITAKLLESSDLLYLHAGYYYAAISREYNTSPWAVSSFDKTFSVWYLRKFMTGQGNGIESGAGLGGLKNFDAPFSVSYRLAVHTPKAHASAAMANPLASGRIMLAYGDPEQKKYKYMLSGSQWGRRKGVTLGLGGAYQGMTDNGLSGSSLVRFDHGAAYGADLAFHYAGFSLDGEYFVMKRLVRDASEFDGREWHARLAYLLPLGAQFIEPSVMLAKYVGAGGALFPYRGDDATLDMGINWYLKKDNLKVSLHYIMQSGSVSTNQGDYAGVGLQIKL